MRRRVFRFLKASKVLYSTAVPPETFFILPRVVLIPFPTPEQCGPISSYFNTQVSTKYMVWNLSEYPHPTQIFAGQSIDFIFVGYPNPPLFALFSIFNSIEKWLASDPNSFALLHCQATKGRSYMILACYLAWIQEIDTVMEGFTKICRITGVKAEMFPRRFGTCGMCRKSFTTPHRGLVGFAYRRLFSMEFRKLRLKDLR